VKYDLFKSRIPQFVRVRPFVFARAFTSTGLRTRNSYLICRDTCRRDCPFSFMFVWAPMVIVVGLFPFPITVIGTTPRSRRFRVLPTHTQSHAQCPTTSEFPSLSLRRICFFLYIGDLFNMCMIQLYI
jgi:hypothetical protein